MAEAANGDGADGAAGADGLQERFAAEARERRPDLGLLCLLVGALAGAARRPVGRTAARGPDGGRERGGEAPAAGARKGPEEGAEGGAAAERGMDEAQIELDRLTGLLPYERDRTPAGWARALQRLLGAELGFGGRPADFQRLESSLLQSVLRRRRGLPILLSVVWMEVARRAGAPVYGVALPGHFVVGFGAPSGDHVLADPYRGGRLLADGDLAMLVAEAAGERRTVSHAMLQPASAGEIVLRVLNNIRAWAAARPEQSAVHLRALELSLLLPHHPARLRYERARLLVERGDFIRGAEEMEAYAAVVSAMQPAAADAVRRAARAARARLN